ncbi:hypothetical protein P886_2803 [Alteromonadaceae bacterium 2753L.S.0a.02]|nr:hypothetical protein P886_2803 [Alteromonadaceae bacterium 2753L.S.0a.02]
MFDSINAWLDLLPRDSLLSLLIVALVISVFLNLYAMNSGSKNAAALKGKHIPNLVKKYLLDQQRKTHLELESGNRSLNNNAMRLREAYLAIEAKSIDRGENTEEYWNLINAKLTKLLAIYEKNKPLSLLKFIEEKIAMIHRELELAPPSVGKDSVVRGLHKLHSICIAHEHNAEKIEHISDKLSAVFFKLRSANYKSAAGKVAVHVKYTDDGHRLIEKIGDSVSNMMQRTSELQSAVGHENDSLTRMHEYSSQMKGQAHSLRDEYLGFKDDVQGLSNQLRDSATESEVNAIDRKIIDLSEEIVAASEKEIIRLKVIVKEKKAIIRQLEEQLSSPPNPTNSVGAGNSELPTVKDSDLELLRKNLRESEQCIKMLEDELELLKTQTSKVHTDSAANQEHALLLLQQSITEANKELSDYRELLDRKDVIFDFLRECIDSSSPPDVALFLYQCLQDLGYDSELLVAAGDKKLELNREGKLSVSQKMLIDSVRIGEFNSSERGKKIVYRYRNFGGVSRRTDGKAFRDNEKKSLADLFSICEKVFVAINEKNAQATRKHEVSKLVNSYKYLVSEVDAAIDKVLKNAQTNAQSNFAQATDIARRGGLNAQLIARIKSLEKEFISDLSAEELTKIRLRKSQLEILKKLEDLES